MSPKGTSVQALQERATAKGYVPGAHREQDSVNKKVRYSPKVTINHRHSLRVYQKLGANSNPPTSLTDASCSWLEAYPPEQDLSLWKGRPPLDLATVRDFLRFYVGTSKGRLDLDKRVTAELVVSFTEWFFAAYTEVTEVPINKEYRLAVYKVTISLLRWV